MKASDVKRMKELETENAKLMTVRRTKPHPTMWEPIKAGQDR
jgi:hypothetical protein